LELNSTVNGFGLAQVKSIAKVKDEDKKTKNSSGKEYFDLKVFTTGSLM